MITEREAFEENLSAHSDKAGHYKISGDYANRNVQNDWVVWQASRKVALEDALNCYSPDDTLTDYQDKIKELK